MAAFVDLKERLKLSFLTLDYCGKGIWIDQQRISLLNTHYFHVVFTVPSELNQTFLHNQRTAYALLFQAASETVLELCADRKYLGAKPGITAVLHTWGAEPPISSACSYDRHRWWPDIGC